MDFSQFRGPGVSRAHGLLAGTPRGRLAAGLGEGRLCRVESQAPSA